MKVAAKLAMLFAREVQTRKTDNNNQREPTTVNIIQNRPIKIVSKIYSSPQLPAGYPFLYENRKPADLVWSGEW